MEIRNHPEKDLHYFCFTDDEAGILESETEWPVSDVLSLYFNAQQTALIKEQRIADLQDSNNPGFHSVNQAILQETQGLLRATQLSLNLRDVGRKLYPELFPQPIIK